MANYRQIHVNIWKDEWFLDLPPEEKLLFIYLFSNESTSLSGIYKIALKVIAFETGLDPDTINWALTKFADDGKVYYQDGLIWVVNMREYNRGGDTVYKRILSDVEALPDCELKRKYLQRYPQATVSPKVSETPVDTLPIDYTQPIDREYGLDVKLNEMKLNESKTLAAKAAPATPSKTEKPLKYPERDAVIKHFLIKTGLRAPKTDTAHIKETQKLWWTPAADLLELVDKDVGAAISLIDSTLKSMNGLTVSSFKSILSNARDEYAKSHRESVEVEPPGGWLQ